MSEIDSIEISIQSNIDKVNKNMDLLIGKMGIVAQGISAIGSNKGLEEFAKKAQSISSDMNKIGKSVSQSVKPIEEQVGKIAKTFEQVKEPFKDLGKGFKVSGGIADIQKSLQRYENELEKANLKEQELSAKGMTDTKGYRDAVADIAKYENVIESLKNQLESINKIQATAKIRIDGRESAERYLVEFKKELEDFRQGIKSMSEVYGGIENVPKGGLDTPIENLTSSLDELKSAYPQAISVISAFEEELKNLQTVSSNLTKEQIKVNVDEEPIKTATQSIREKIEYLSETFKESGKDFVFEGNAEQLEKQIQKVSAELDGLFSRQDKMIELGKVNTEPFKNLIRDIENARNRLEILENTRPEALNRTLQENAEKARIAAEQLKAFESNLSKLQVPPVDETNLKKLQTALKKTEADLEKLRLKLANGLALGKISANIDDSGYRNLREQIALTEKQAEALREKMGSIGAFERLKQSMSGASSISKKLQKSFSTLYASLKKISNGIKSVLSKIGSLIKSMFSLGNATKKSNGGFNLGLKTILKYGFGIRSLYVLVNKLRSAIKEGMKNLIQYSDQTNQSVSMLSSSMSQFKNASAAAFAPILNTIAPVLNQLIQLFIRATNAVNQFFSALTGHGTWIKAKYVYEDVAESISGAADTAKGALQPFDKLNNLTTQKGAGGVSPEDMFETVPVEDKFKDLADWLKDMWKNADFYDLGRKLGEELQHALANIPWDKIKATARKLGKSLATLINGFVEVEGLGKAIGYSLAQALNTAYEFANSFVHSLNWESIGKFIAETINGFIQNIDWSLIRDTLITGAKGLADAINSFVDYLDWDTVASTISNSINLLSDTIIMFFERTDWSELGHKIGYTLEKSIENIDFERVGMAIADILQSALDFASGVIAELNWDEIKSAIKDLLTGFFGNITIPDNLKGIITALAGIEGAVLSLKAVMGTAKLAKVFSDIWDVAKKLQKLKLPKMFTDIKGAFSPFSDAFKQFKNSFAIRGDLFGSFKNGFSSLSSGLKTFRENLSPATKGVVGLTTVFAEFKIVGNAFDDIIKGTGNLSTSIGKIVAAAGAAATALSVVFGVPAGIIIAGVTAAIAGLKSLNDHFNELEVERVGERIRDSLSVPGGVPLDSIVDQYADSFAEMRGQFTNISDQATKVDMLDDSITNVYQDIDKIRTSMENGVISVEEGAEQLKTLFADLEQITAEKFGAIENTLYSAFGEGGAFRESFEEIGGNAQDVLAKVSGISVEMQDRIREINELQMSLDPLSEEYQKLEDEKRAITGSLDSVTEAFNQFSTDISSLNIDYSNLFDESGLNSKFDTTISSLVESGKSYQESIKDSTNELINQFTELANAARATGDEETASYFEEQAELARQAGGDLQNQVGEQAKQVTDKIQSDFIDAIGEQITKAQSDWDNLGTGEKLMMSMTKGIDTQDEYVKSQIEAFKTNTLDPMSQQIDEALTQLGIDGAGWASDATQQIVDGLFDTTVVVKGAYTDVDSVLASNWTEILENLKEDVKPKSEEAGKYIGDGLIEGMKNVDFSTASGELFGTALSEINKAFGIASPAKNMMPSGEYITLGILEGFKSKFSEFPSSIMQMCSLIKTNVMTGLQNVKSVWQGMWSSFTNIVNEVFNSISKKVSSFVQNISGLLKGFSASAKSVTSGSLGNLIGGSLKTRSQSVSIPQYSSGGFPDRYSLFTAGEQGVPEILGTVGGKTAVAGGDEITGIASAVYSTGKTEAQLLSEAVRLLQMIAEKDGYNSSKVFNDMREEATSYKKRTGDYAFT